MRLNETGALMHIEGEMEIGEASKYAAKASGRLSGHPKPLIIANLAAALATVLPLVVFGIWQSAVDAPAWLWLPILPAAMVFGFWAGPAACRRYTVEMFRRNLAERGLDTTFVSSFTLDDDGLVSSTGRVTMTAQWAAVSDIMRTDRYWIFLVEGYPQFLPRRFFSSQTEEQAFLAAVLARMLPEARARSGEAVAFAAA